MEKTILDYINLIKKRLWLITVFVLISCATTFYVSKNFVVPVYSASGQLLVNNVVNVPESNNLNALNFSLNLIESYKEIMKSPTIMKSVIAEHPEFGLTAGQLAAKLQIKSSEKSQVINLSVQDEDYATAATIVNAVSQTFIRSLPALMNLDNVTFLTPADPANQPGPVNSGSTMNIIISFVVSLMAAVGIILLMETLNGTLRSEKEAEFDLGLPVIASIPAIRKRDLGKAANAKARVGRALMLRLNRSLITDMNPSSHISESFRSLRTYIRQLGLLKGNGGQVLLFTSAEGGEGKTTILSNLAVSFVQDGKKVAVVDCNLRKPGLHSVFEVEGSQGLAAYLAGYEETKDIAVYGSLANLAVIPAGITSVSPRICSGATRCQPCWKN